VNAVAPGPVWTPLNPADQKADRVANFGQQSKMKRAPHSRKSWRLRMFFSLHLLAPATSWAKSFPWLAGTSVGCWLHFPEEAMHAPPSLRPAALPFLAYVLAIGE
jgi:hypothetical protein